MEHISGADVSNVGFQILTVDVMNYSIFCNIMPCIPLKVSRRYRGAFRSKACCLLRAGSFLFLFFNPENGGEMFLRNVG
jgi:hypothetical protein